MIWRETVALMGEVELICVGTSSDLPSGSLKI